MVVRKIDNNGPNLPNIQHLMTGEKTIRTLIKREIIFIEHEIKYIKCIYDIVETK